MGSAWVQGYLRGHLWLPLFCVIFSQACCSHAPPGWHFTSSEVVVPRKVSHQWSGAQAQGQLSYRLVFRGQRHVLHMKIKRNIMPRHFPVLTNNDQGAMQEDYPFVPRDCYYYSYLEGVPGSTGTLDTCYGGLRGMLQVDDFTYEIKPLEASSRFEHLISLLVMEEPSGIEGCDIGERNHQSYEEAMLSEAPRAGPVYLWWPHTKHLKLHYTVAKSLVDNNSNLTSIVENIVILNSIIHTVYIKAFLNVNIRILCIWDRYDSFNYYRKQNISDAINEFGIWKFYAVFHLFPHDASFLLTGDRIYQRTYFAFQGSLCNPNWSAAYVYIARKHIFLGALLIAHAVCHLFGCAHDSSSCHCFRRTSCLMSPEPGLHDMVSNCTFERMQIRFNGWDACLSVRNVPYYNFPYETLRCGDKIINQKEECDCGSLKECARDPCCETTCALSLGSICDEGGCCKRCKYAPPGVMCRDKLGICDLPEYCDGKKATCPQDVYIQDGTPCSPLAVCMHGNCSDRDMQCQSLFGYKIKDGSPACYQQLNRRGDRFGNCGVRAVRGGGKPLPCEEDDVFCGMLHCADVREVPGAGEHTTFHQIKVKHIKEENCFGFDAHFGTELPVMGLVVDGATCGPGCYCKNQNCTFFQDLNFDCDVKTCNFRGVCNSLKHCHCLKGWKPPSCAERGIGGSIDSGPPPSREYHIQGTVVPVINAALVLICMRFIFLIIEVFLGCCLRVEAMSAELETGPQIIYIKSSVKKRPTQKLSSKSKSSVKPMPSQKPSSKSLQVQSKSTTTLKTVPEIIYIKSSLKERPSPKLSIKSKSSVKQTPSQKLSSKSKS